MRDSAIERCRWNFDHFRLDRPIRAEIYAADGVNLTDHAGRQPDDDMKRHRTIDICDRFMAVIDTERGKICARSELFIDFRIRFEGYNF